MLEYCNCSSAKKPSLRWIPIRPAAKRPPTPVALARIFSPLGAHNRSCPPIRRFSLYRNLSDSGSGSFPGCFVVHAITRFWPFFSCFYYAPSDDGGRPPFYFSFQTAVWALSTIGIYFAICFFFCLFLAAARQPFFLFFDPSAKEWTFFPKFFSCVSFYGYPFFGLTAVVCSRLGTTEYSKMLFNVPSPGHVFVAMALAPDGVS